MKIFDKFVLGTAATLFVFEVFPLSVSAYLDPSAITYTIQLVAGLVIAAGAALVIFRHKLMKLVRKLFGGKKTETKKQIHIKEENENSVPEVTMNNRD